MFLSFHGLRNKSALRARLPCMMPGWFMFTDGSEYPVAHTPSTEWAAVGFEATATTLQTHHLKPWNHKIENHHPPNPMSQCPRITNPATSHGLEGEAQCKLCLIKYLRLHQWTTNAGALEKNPQKGSMQQWKRNIYALTNFCARS